MFQSTDQKIVLSPIQMELYQRGWGLIYLETYVRYRKTSVWSPGDDRNDLIGVNGSCQKCHIMSYLWFFGKVFVDLGTVQCIEIEWPSLILAAYLLRYLWPTLSVEWLWDMLTAWHFGGETLAKNIALSRLFWIFILHCYMGVQSFWALHQKIVPWKQWFWWTQILSFQCRWSHENKWRH